MTEHLPILLLIIFLGSIFSTLAGGGLGIILIITFSFFLDIQTGIFATSLLGFVVQPAKFVHFGKYAKWDVIRWYVLSGIPLSYIGGRLLFTIPSRIVEISIAIICVLFVVSHIVQIRFHVEPSKRAFLIMGAAQGFVGGITGNGNILRNPFLLALGLHKEVFIATASAISLFINLGKISAYLPNIQWSSFLVLLLLFSMPVVFLGVFLGKKYMYLVSEEVFERLVIFVILLGTVKLLLYP